jgi:hypothetical protein
MGSIECAENLHNSRMIKVRDAIVISGWTWEAANVPERMALALARAGSRVLYCENPVSVLRNPARKLTEVESGVFALGLGFLGHRLNSLGWLSRLQGRLLVGQILENARTLGLRDPYFVYPHGNFFLTVCKEFKERRFPLIHVCMDYEPELTMEQVQLSDVALVIPRAAFEEFKERFGEKVRLLPQFASFDGSELASAEGAAESPDLAEIARPRLGYLGTLVGRVSLPLVCEVLSAQPEWQFLSFEASKRSSLPNEHVLPWRSRREIFGIISGLDVGFMPYDCSIPKNLHCVPLKLFDYFARGIPVVSTPIVHVGQYSDLVYVGATAKQLEEAVLEALNEPPDSSKRIKRMAIAREHSIDSLSRLLPELLATTDRLEMPLA